MGKAFGEDFYGKVHGQMRKVRIDRDGTFRAPVKADGKDGIVVGDPPIMDFRRDLPATSERPGLLARVRAAVRR